MREIKNSKFKVMLLFTLIFSLMLINTAFAEDVDVNQTAHDDNFTSIQNLIDNANSGDSIYLEEKTYVSNGSAINIEKDISIYGVDSSKTILDGDGKSNIFVISKNANVNLIGLTLSNGFTASNGAAIDNYGKLFIYNSTVSNNVADRGTIHCSDKSDLRVFNSVFNNNRAVSGAAIENDNANGILKIVNTTFTDNYCDRGSKGEGEGGAIYNIWGECLIYNSTFSNNFASRGGAIYNNRGTLKVYNTKVTSNICDDLGAGIKSWGICEVYDSLIANNTNTAKQGGGFYVSEFSLKICNCTVENNTAVWGGGVYVEAKATLNVANSKIINNSAERGGGIDVNQGSIYVTDSVISNNVATDDGGAVRCSFLSSEIKNTIIENNAAKYGGAIYIDGISLKANNITLTNNSAGSNGGAIYNSGTLTLNNALLNSNVANGDGGAIYNSGTSSISDVDLNFNAANNGGAIYNKNTLTLINSIANNNKASIYAGVLYNTATSTVNNMNSKSNEAKFGGVIYTDKTIQIKDSIFDSNKASEAGAIYASGILNIDNSQFMNNQISRKGAAMSIHGDVNITSSLFTYNRGADEGGSIFTYSGTVLLDGCKFISNTARSYGGAIDNSADLTISNSLFDKNQAYGAGAIDNGGKLNIISSNFTNNYANEKNGGAIDNKGNMTVIGSIFDNNIAEGDGGAIIARRATEVSHSIITNNRDVNGFAIFNTTWDEIDFSNNWWGVNNPDFEKLLNFNISDDFKWIVMKFENLTPLSQKFDAIISFDNVVNKSNDTLKRNDSNLLAIFKVDLSNGEVLSIKNGSMSKTITSSTNSITAKKDNESITLVYHPSEIKRITNNKNVVVDYNGKATFKVRVIGDDGRAVSKGITIIMKVGSTSYKVTTDKNGYASKTFDFKPGKYTVTTSYKGFSVKNTITIKKVLTAKSATKKKAKKIKYTATLKNSKGKSIKSKTVSFKIKGKTYSAKTNSKGIATVYFKNLKACKYTVVVKYLKSQVKTTLKVKK